MYRHFFKRAFDLIFALLAIPFFIAIFIFVGPAIYFQDKGPIFYNAPRLGKNGKVFKMYKFRSMKMNALDIRNEDGSTFNAENDPRLTKIGKFIRKTSIDEIPQILNILIGDMSFVGPRPDLPEALVIYNDMQKNKINTRPGITGYSQAYYRNSIQMDEKFNIDVKYVEKLSFLLDIKIILKTIISILCKRNIFYSQ